ncbi:MAG: hypothetical protein PHT51_05185 [Patescibacteria group bacterium]|nr:hypothetical protein [Patescibacteria group bacterium]MDD4611214.1 hypothetical protein [Patescibacteria group bacterium]
MKKKKNHENGNGRNTICPVCGKKQKYCKGHMPPWQKTVVAVLVCSLFLALIFAGRFWIKEETARRNQQEIARTASILSDYLSKHPNTETWWLKNVDPRKLDEFLELTQSKTRHLAELVQRFGNVSPLSVRIAKHFKLFHLTVYNHGMSFSINKADEMPPEDALEICFVPLDQDKEHPSAFYYRAEWKALMLSSVECPDPIFAPLLFHELVHALHHLVDKAASATAPPDSDLYVAEEIEAHELEAEILNAATNNRFYRHIDELLKRSGAHNFQEAIFAVTAKDLEKIDAITGGNTCSQKIASLAISQYLAVIGLRQINKEGGQLTEKIQLYRWLIKNF